MTCTHIGAVLGSSLLESAMSCRQGSLVALVVALLVWTGTAFADGVHNDNRGTEHGSVTFKQPVRTFTAPNDHSSAFLHNTPRGNAYGYGHNFSHYGRPTLPVSGHDQDGPRPTVTVPEGSGLLMLGSTLLVLAGAIRRRVLA